MRCILMHVIDVCTAYRNCCVMVRNRKNCSTSGCQLYELCIEECELRILVNLGCSRVDMAHTPQARFLVFSNPAIENFCGKCKFSPISLISLQRHPV